MLQYNFTFPIISHNVLKQQNAPEREIAGRVLLFLFSFASLLTQTALPEGEPEPREEMLKAFFQPHRPHG